MTRALPLVVVLLSGCATTQVTARFGFDAPPETVRAAVTEAAAGFGWASHAAADGKLTLVERRTGGVQLEAEFPEGALRLTGPAVAGRLVPSGAFLAAATRGVLEVPAAPVLTPRSGALAVGLDLVLPAAGSLYARDFDHELFAGDSPRMNLLVRLLMDAVGVEMILLSRLEHDGPIASTVFLVEGLATLVLNRVGAMIIDLESIGIRNTAVAFGLRVPTIEAIEREANGAVVER